MKEKCKYGRASGKFALVERFNILCFTILFLTGISLFSCSGRESTEEHSTHNDSMGVVYYCPMHPDIVSNKPGKCPKPECHGMDLVLKTSDTLLERVLRPVNNTVLASVKTINPSFKKMHLTVQANGYIDYDTRNNASISTLYSGRIEKLYIKYNYQPIHKGELIFEIYSPELVTTQENLIALLTHSPEESTLIQSVEQKLKLLGFSDTLLQTLVRTKKIMMAVPVYSNYEGYIRASSAKTTPAAGMTPMTSQPKQNAQLNTQLLVREGQYVTMGETLFDVVNINTVMAILQIKQEDISKISKGQRVEIRFDNDSSGIKGKIDFIEPIFNVGKKSSDARVYLNNSNRKLKIGVLIRATIEGETLQALWIPSSAVMDLGREKKVWLKRNGLFVAKTVETGVRAGKEIEISDGLTDESEIAEEAHYLIDSEGFVKENLHDD